MYLNAHQTNGSHHNGGGNVPSHYQKRQSKAYSENSMQSTPYSETKEKKKSKLKRLFKS